MKTYIPQNMTVSGLERYVRIHQGIINSKAMLSTQDASDLFHMLITAPRLWTIEEIEQQCIEMENTRMGDNMVRAGILRYAGY